MVFQEEVTAEESTDGEVEAQTYNQDSQDSIGEVSIFEKKKKNHSFRKKTFSFLLLCHTTLLKEGSQIRSYRMSVENSYNRLKFKLAIFKNRY